MDPRTLGSRTYAQHGDDIIIAAIFQQIGIAKPSYLDIGAFDSWEISNTAWFYERGSRGINVEPNPRRFQDLRTHRPLDITLCAAVGPELGTDVPFFIASNPGLSSLKTSEITKHGAKIVNEVKTPVVTVSWIVREHAGGRFPDLLDLDAEGMDLAILRSMSGRHVKLAPNEWPKVICVEAIRGDAAANEIYATILSFGFFFVIRAGNNAIFVREDFHGRMF